MSKYTIEGAIANSLALRFSTNATKEERLSGLSDYLTALIEQERQDAARECVDAAKKQADRHRDAARSYLARGPHAAYELHADLMVAWDDVIDAIRAHFKLEKT